MLVPPLPDCGIHEHRPDPKRGHEQPDDYGVRGWRHLIGETQHPRRYEQANAEDDGERLLPGLVPHSGNRDTAGSPVIALL